MPQAHFEHVLMFFFLQYGFPKEEGLEDFNVLIDKFEGDAAALGNVVYANSVLNNVFIDS